MKLVYPTIKYKEKAIEYVKEFERAKSKVNGSSGLNKYINNLSYEDWLEKIQREINVVELSDNENPALTYFYVDDNDEIIGIINCRFGLTSQQEQDYGHIGYSIRPSMRNKGYGTKMLKEALKIYKKTKYFEVYVNALVENKASIKVIENNGGVFVKTYMEDKYGGKCACYKIPIYYEGKVVHSKK